MPTNNRFAILALIIFANCGGNEMPPCERYEDTMELKHLGRITYYRCVAPLTYDITIDQTDDGQFSAKLPDGTEYNDLETYQREIQRIVAEQTAKGYQVQINLGASIGKKLDESFGELSTAETTGTIGDIGFKNSALRIPFTDYNITTAKGKTYVSGCVHRNAYRVALHLNKGKPGQQVFDVHVAAYTENWKPCFGVYESVSNWTWCSCDKDSWQRVWTAIKNAAIAAGISAGIAEIIASIGLPVVVAGLAL